MLSTFKVRILYFVAIIFCTLSISMSSFAQTSPGSDSANSVFSFDLLGSLFSSTLSSDKPSRTKRDGSDASVSTNKLHEKMFGRDSSPLPPIDCGKKCGNGEGNARDPLPRGNVE